MATTRYIGWIVACDCGHTSADADEHALHWRHEHALRCDRCDRWQDEDDDRDWKGIPEQIGGGEHWLDVTRWFCPTCQ